MESLVQCDINGLKIYISRSIKEKYLIHLTQTPKLVVEGMQNDAW